MKRDLTFGTDTFNTTYKSELEYLRKYPKDETFVRRDIKKIISSLKEELDIVYSDDKEDMQRDIDDVITHHTARLQAHSDYLQEVE